LRRILSESTREDILSRILPTREEVARQKETIEQLTSLLDSEGRAKGFKFSFIEAQGSTGKKQTQLRGAADIDLFVGLKPRDYRDLLDLPSKKRHRALDMLMNDLIDKWFIPAVSRAKVSQLEKTYSQHPYLSLKMHGLEIDILSCFDITQKELEREGVITAVDRTRHHTEFIAQRLDERSRENARILKSFVRAAHAYGDRCAVGRMGFTGVTLEYVAILSESLEEAVDRLHSLDSIPIDHENRSLEELRKIPTFRDDRMFVIDPTDATRNMASSLSSRAYSWVRHRIEEVWAAAAENRTKDVFDYFIESPVPDDEIPEWLADHAFAVEYASDGTVHYTILRDKLYRLSNRMRGELEAERAGETRFGQVLSEVYFEEDRYAVGFLVENPTIDQEYLRRGPKISIRKACTEFKESHPEAEERDGYLWTREKRKWTQARAMIEALLRKNRVAGLTPADRSVVSRRVLNVLYRYVMPIEHEFTEKMTRVKDVGRVES